MRKDASFLLILKLRVLLIFHDKIPSLFLFLIIIFSFTVNDVYAAYFEDHVLMEKISNEKLSLARVDLVDQITEMKQIHDNVTVSFDR